MEKDWKKLYRRISKIISGIAMILVVYIISSSFAKCIEETKIYLHKQNNQQLEETISANAMNIQIELESNLNYIRACAGIFEDMQDLHSKEAMEKLIELKKYSVFRFMFLTKENGDSKEVNGTVTNVSDMNYFKKTMQGEYVVEGPTKPKWSKNIVISISVPIYKEGEVVGALQGAYPVTRFEYFTKLSGMNEEAKTIIVGQRGEIIYSNSNNVEISEEPDTFNEVLEQSTFLDDNSTKAIKNYITKKQSGIYHFNILGEEKIMYYAPIGGVNWYLFQALPVSVLDKNVNPIKHINFIMVLKISFAFLILVIIILQYFIKVRQERKEGLIKIQTLTENIPGGVAEILLNEDKLYVTYANDGFFAMTGYKKDEYIEKGNGCLSEHLPESHNVKAIKKMKQALEEHISFQVEIPFKRKDGYLIWMQMVGKSCRVQGNKPVFQVILTDITEQKKKNKELLDKARRDKMTGLYDKVTTEEMVRKAISREGQVMNALVIIDIDDFKSINDSYGHQMGDQVIIQIADILLKSFRSSDVVGRIGGDEFMVLLYDTDSREVIDQKLKKLFQEFKNIGIIEDNREVSCSVGVTMFSIKKENDYTKLFKITDNHLYEAKKNGKNQYVIYEL